MSQSEKELSGMEFNAYFSKQMNLIQSLLLTVLEVQARIETKNDINPKETAKQVFKLYLDRADFFRDKLSEYFKST